MGLYSLFIVSYAARGLTGRGGVQERVMLYPVRGRAWEVHSCPIMRWPEALFEDSGPRILQA